MAVRRSRARNACCSWGRVQPSAVQMSSIFNFHAQVFGKIGAGVLDQGVLAALPPDAGHGAAQAAAAPGQQDQQVFQVDDELLHRAEGQLLFYDGPPARYGRGVEQLVGGVGQPVQIVLLGGLGVEHRTAEPVHGRAGAVKIDAQRLGRDLPHRRHGEHLAGLVEQKPARPQQHMAVRRSVPQWCRCATR